MPAGSPLLPPLTRGTGRAVRRRTRTFRPNYLSFAGTYQCNLSCPHCCVPIEWPERLDIKVALRFLEDAHAYGIGIVGFTGASRSCTRSLCIPCAGARPCWVFALTRL